MLGHHIFVRHSANLAGLISCPSLPSFLSPNAINLRIRLLQVRENGIAILRLALAFALTSSALRLGRRLCRRSLLHLLFRRRRGLLLLHALGRFLLLHLLARFRPRLPHHLRPLFTTRLRLFAFNLLRHALHLRARNFLLHLLLRAASYSLTLRLLSLLLSLRLL
jgi:hypothetical protein